MKKWICNKAGTCERQFCTVKTPHDFLVADCANECVVIDGAHCIRHRHPLEVVLIKEIAELLRVHTSCIIGSERGVDALLLARRLWGLLKESRKLISTA